MCHFLQEYPISDFGRSVVASLAEEPLFRMSELNPRLSRRVAKLRKAVEARREAALAFPYLLTCKADEMSNRYDIFLGLSILFHLHPSQWQISFPLSCSSHRAYKYEIW